MEEGKQYLVFTRYAVSRSYAYENTVHCTYTDCYSTSTNNYSEYIVNGHFYFILRNEKRRKNHTNDSAMLTRQTHHMPQDKESHGSSSGHQ